MNKNNGRNNKGKFTKGNTLSVGNKGGRKRIFETPEDMEKAIQGYYDTLGGSYEEGFDRMPMLSGLAFFAGCGRETIRRTINRSPEFRDTYMRFKAVCEYYLEKDLYRTKGSVRGTIFTLRNNFGWKTN